MDRQVLSKTKKKSTHPNCMDLFSSSQIILNKPLINITSSCFSHDWLSPISPSLFSPSLSLPCSCLHVSPHCSLQLIIFLHCQTSSPSCLNLLSETPLHKPLSSLHKSLPCPHFPEQPSSASSCVCLVLFRVEPWIALICVCKAPCKLTALQSRVSYFIRERDWETTLRIIKIVTIKAAQSMRRETVQILV